MKEQIYNEVIEELKREKWYPMVHPTDIEIETSKLLNDIIDRIIESLEKKI